MVGALRGNAAPAPGLDPFSSSRGSRGFGTGLLPLFGFGLKLGASVSLGDDGFVRKFSGLLVAGDLLNGVGEADDGVDCGTYVGPLLGPRYCGAA